MDKELMNFISYLIMSNRAVIDKNGHILSIKEIQSDIKYYLEQIRGKEI